MYENGRDPFGSLNYRQVMQSFAATLTLRDQEADTALFDPNGDTWQISAYCSAALLCDVANHPEKQRTTKPDPLLPFHTLAVLPPIDLTADIRREYRGGSR